MLKSGTVLPMTAELSPGREEMAFLTLPTGKHLRCEFDSGIPRPRAVSPTGHPAQTAGSSTIEAEAAFDREHALTPQIGKEALQLNPDGKTWK